MVAFARAFIQLEPDMRTFAPQAKAGVAKAGLAEEGTKHGKSFGAKFGGAAKLALAGLGTLVAFKGIQFFGDIVKQGAEAARVNRIVAAAIKSTGGAANISTGQIDKLTESIGNQAGVDDSVVKSGTAMLLTFRNIRNEQGKGNDIFNQANKTLVDMTAALHGGDVSSDSLRKQAIQLGKALNDPVKGLTALQRVGVTFTDGQKKQIEALASSGHRMEAQKLILRELGKEFGGAAAASASPMQKLQAQLHNFEEGIGTALLPVLNVFIKLLMKFLMPALSSFADWFKNTGAAALRRFGTAALPVVVEAIKTFAAGISAIVKAFLALPGPIKIAIGVLAGLAAAFVLVSANPFIAIIGGVILLTGLIVRNWGTIKRVTLEVWGGIAGFFVDVWHNIYSGFVGPIVNFFTKSIPHAFGVVIDWAKANWPLLIGLLTGPIGFAVAWIIQHWDQVAGFFTGLWHRIWTSAKNVWNAIVGWFVAFFNREIQGWKNIWNAISGFFVALWNRVWNGAKNIWNTIAGWFRSLFNREIQGWKNIWNGITGFFSGLWNRVWTGAKNIWSSIIGWFRGIPGRIMNSLQGLGSSLYSFAQQALQKFWNGAKSIGGAVVSWFKNLAGSIISGIKHIFGIASPSSVFFDIGANLIRGLVAGIKKHYGATAVAVGNIKYHVGAGVEQWAGLVKRALAMEGLSPMLAGRVLFQMQTESGGNPNAINRTDINAQRGDPSRGLLQTIMSTFRAYHWPGTSWNIYDPLANIAAAINYARHVYGPSLMSGGMGMGSGHGYALGGPITEPIVGYGRSGRKYTFGEAGDETVVPGRFTTAGVEARLDALIAAVQQNAAQTGAALSGALNGTARSAAQRAFYATR